MSTHRVSLVQELEGRDPHYVSARINDVLNTLPPDERQNVLANYTQKAPQVKDKTSFMVNLIDALFDRKHKAQQQPQAAPPPPIYTPISRHSVPLPVKQQVKPIHPRPASCAPGTISGPVPLDDSRIIGDKQVADYTFIKTLGKGTFGKVKLAEHIRTKQKVAIKVIEKANIKTAKQRTSVDREVRLIKLLHHPHIVGVYDVFEAKDYIWIIMEHASGGELFDYIVKNGMIKETEARRFFRQILSAVEYCHLNSIIHRDLKPENLLLDDQLNIKVIDFGFGNTYHRERYLETFCGSPFYAAPEMLQGVRYIGPEVDIWSMGVILYALLSGRLPFDATNMNELYGKIGRGKYACPSHFSAEAVHLISRMLTVDPKKRATISEIKHHVWVNMSHTEMVQSYLNPRPTVVESPSRKSLGELVSYGFKEEEATRILRYETNPHPIVSLYHLIDEARQRKEAQMEKEQQAADAAYDALSELAQSERTNSLATIGTPSSSRAPPMKPTSPMMLVDVSVPAALPRQPVLIPAQPRLNFNTYFQKLAYGGARKPPQQDMLLPERPSSAAHTTNTAAPPCDFIHGVVQATTAVAMVPAVGSYCSNSYPGANPVLIRPSTAPHSQAVIAARRLTPRLSGAASPVSGGEWPSMEDATGGSQRPVRGFFNIQTSSTRRSDEIVCEVERVLGANEIAFEKLGRLLFVCEEKGNRFEIEICKHVTALSPATTEEGRDTPAAIHDIYLRRLRGNVWTHKRICARLIEQMRL